MLCDLREDLDMKRKYTFKATGNMVIPYEEVLTVVARNEEEGRMILQEGIDQIAKERYGSTATWYSCIAERIK